MAFAPGEAAAPFGGEQDPAADLQKSLNTVPLDPQQISDWWARIKASSARIEQRETKWDALGKEYVPVVSDGAGAEDVKANSHFRNIHTKTGQLFVRSPKVIMTPKGPALDQTITLDPMTGQQIALTAADTVPVRQAVINYFMSPDEIDGVRLIDECLFDMQGYSGIAAVKIGYRSVSRTVQKPVLQPDPSFVPPEQPGMLGLSPTPPAPQVPVLDPMTGQPQTEAVPIIIYEQWYAEKLSSKKLLLDEQLHSPHVEKRSRWIGWKNFVPKRQAMRLYGLTDEDLGAGAEEDDRIFRDEADHSASSAALKDLVAVYEIFYKGVYFTDDEDHPDAIYQLVLLDNLKERTIVSRKSVDQTFDEQGKLTYDSLVGFPIKVGSLRDFLDSPYAIADSAFTNSLAKNLDVHLQQNLKTRDAAIGKYMYDTDAIDAEDLKKIKDGSVGEFIGLKSGALAQGADKVFATTAQVHQTNDDWRTADTLKSTMNETLGINETAAGGNPDTVRSATEIKSSTAGSEGRQEKEQARAIEFYLSIVRAVDTLVFRYATGERYVTVVGEDGTKKLEQWNKKLGAGCYAYDIKPDSQLRNDVARDRQQKIAAYTVMAPDQMVNRPPMLRDIARDFGWDPSLIVLATPPEQMMQPPHGGSANKHMSERSGDTPNAPGAADSGSNRQERNPRPGGPP
jgi:hypothetical protein